MRCTRPGPYRTLGATVLSILSFAVSAFVAGGIVVLSVIEVVVVIAGCLLSGCFDRGVVHCLPVGEGSDLPSVHPLCGPSIPPDRPLENG